MSGCCGGLRGALPPPAPDTELRHALLHFYHGIARADIGLHLASIAALDSAVCLILAALLEPDRVLAKEPAANAIFRRIHSDEARHVRLSRQIAAELVQGDVIGAVGENARLGLVGVLTRRGAAFDSLGARRAKAALALRNPRRSSMGFAPKVRFAVDSPLEGGRFEPSVPRLR
jgi:hypothetical protein